MDPITRASKIFADEAKTVWQSPAGQVLLMVAPPAERLNLAKLLRAQESALDNRWPLLLYDHAFSDTAAYVLAVQRRIAEDYQALRAGVAEQGVVLDPYQPPAVKASEPAAGIALALEQVAALLGERLAGIHLALLPGRIAQPVAWQALIAELVRCRLSARVRISILEAPGGALTALFPADRRAHFEVNEDELLDYFRQAGSRKSAGPPRQSKVPELTAEQRARVEQRLGRKLMSTESGARLKLLLLDAAQHSRKEKHQRALDSYREAQKLCQTEAAVPEESMVLIALANSYLALGEPQQAVASYQRSAELATMVSLWQVVSQAWLGSGAVYLMQNQLQLAATSYEQSAVAAEQAQVAMLRIEALRMAGTCYHQLGNQRDTARCWQKAVDQGEALPPQLRPATTLPQVAAEFVKLLRKQGLAAQAAHVQSLMDAPAAPAAAGV